MWFLILIIVLILILAKMMNQSISGAGKPVIYLQRHGERLGFSDDAWIKSLRYMENPFDPPLTQKGHDEIQNNIKFMKGVKYIYSSPLTRCMESATEISKVLNIPIRVEYGLVESHTFEQADSNNIPYKSNAIIENGKTYEQIIDSKLEIDSLSKQYPVDITYKSLYGKLPIIESEASLKERHNNIIEALSKDNAVIVCHQDFIENATKYLTKANNHPLYEGGSRWYGVLVKPSQHKVKIWLNGKPM